MKKTAMLTNVFRFGVAIGLGVWLAYLGGGFDDPVPEAAPLPPGMPSWPSNAAHPFR
jgi:hypothetical protein